MGIPAVETLPEAQESQTQCECAAQIADILTRLENLERDALTVEKLSNTDGRNLIVDHVTRSCLSEGLQIRTEREP